jgi:hypothetical protein
MKNLVVWFGDGSGSWTVVMVGEFGYGGVALGDVNSDGREDLAFRTAAGGLEVWAWAGPGAWIELSGSLPASGPWEATQLLDMNADGHVDLCASR